MYPRAARTHRGAPLRAKFCRRLARNQFITQVPPSAPGSILHCKPLQQSASVVHAAVEGARRQSPRRPGAGFRSHWVRTADYCSSRQRVAQAWPEAEHERVRQRFTPVKSGPQESSIPALPLQQSFENGAPHRLPFGLHPTGFLQKPALIPGRMVQVTVVPPYEPALPQHAASAVQRSLVTLQPLGAPHAMPPPGTLAHT